MPQILDGRGWLPKLPQIAGRAQRLGSAIADAPRSRVLWPAILVALACLMMLGLQGWIESEARTAQARATEASLVNLASALTQNADATIEVADTALTGVIGQLEANGTSPAALSSLDRLLKAQRPWFFRFRDISVIGNDGRWLATSLPVTIENSADRSYFRRHRDETGLGLLISPPAKSVVTGRWTIIVSRRFNSADGGFAGVVFAAIEMAYFVDHYASYDLGPNDFILLSTTRGTLLARYPSDEKFIGQTIQNSTAFSKWREHPSGSYVNTAIIDGVRRFTGYSRSDRYRLVVVAAMSEDQALAAWRAAARRRMMTTFVLTGALGLLGLHLIRLIRGTLRGFAKVTYDVTAQRIADEQRAIIIESAANGMMIVDEAGIITLANSQLELIFGYPVGTLIGQSVDLLVPKVFRVTQGELGSAFTSGRSDAGTGAGAAVHRAQAGRQPGDDRDHAQPGQDTARPHRGGLAVRHHRAHAPCHRAE